MRAYFIGTDFNYAHSNNFRKIFLDNSLDIEDIKNQVRMNDGGARGGLDENIIH